MLALANALTELTDPYAPFSPSTAQLPHDELQRCWRFGVSGRWVIRRLVILMKWVCSVEGPKDTPWEGRLIRCTLNFCPEVAGGVYPEKAPQLLVMHPIPYHPNIDLNQALHGFLQSM